MTGHTVTPYEISATRAHARSNKDVKLLLASLGEKTTVDVLDALSNSLATVDPIEPKIDSRGVRCVLTDRDGDKLWLVFAVDYIGQREIVQDGDDPAHPAVFEKNGKHISRFFSVGLIWRPDDGEEGVMLIHSPWGRGGTRSQIMTLLQRSVAATPGAKAKLHSRAMVPEAVVRRIVSNLNSTRVTYVKDTGVQSTFGANSGKKSAPAEMSITVKGSATIPYRDALAAALRSKRNRDGLFVIDVRDEDGGYTTETFDDVQIAVKTASGTREYSLRDETLPTIGFNLTPEINSAYAALPENEHAKWPGELLAATKRHFLDVLGDVRSS